MPLIDLFYTTIYPYAMPEHVIKSSQAARAGNQLVSQALRRTQCLDCHGRPPCVLLEHMLFAQGR